jgi:type IV secretory pathway TrbL component
MAYSFTIPTLDDTANVVAAFTAFGSSVASSVDSEFSSGSKEYRGKSTLSNVAGTVTSVGKIYVQSTQPSGAVIGDIWMW